MEYNENKWAKQKASRFSLNHDVTLYYYIYTIIYNFNINNTNHTSYVINLFMFIAKSYKNI